MTTALKEKLNQIAKEAGIKVKILGRIERLVNRAIDPWEEVRGILKNKKIDALNYQKKVREEWGN